MRRIICAVPGCGRAFESAIANFPRFRQAFLRRGWKMHYDRDGTYYYCPEHDRKKET